MDTTRASLLIRIRNPDDSVAWNEFYQIYAPLIYRFALSRGLNHADAEEIRSSCYETIVKNIESFEYEKQKGGFKAWLRRVVTNRVIDLKRKRMAEPGYDTQLNRVAATEKSPDEMFDEQWKSNHLNYCLKKLKPQFDQTKFQAFMLLLEGNSVELVCEKLSLNANQVYKAKSRILKLVRQELNQIEEFSYAIPTSDSSGDFLAD